MALLQDMNDLIAKKQDELKFYQGADLLLRTTIISKQVILKKIRIP